MKAVQAYIQFTKRISEMSWLELCELMHRDDSEGVILVDVARGRHNHAPALNASNWPLPGQSRVYIAYVTV